MQQIQVNLENYHWQGRYGRELAWSKSLNFFIITAIMRSSTLSPVKPASTQTPRADIDDAMFVAWLAAIAHQDQDAFRVFYEKTVDRVYGLALRITGSPQTAEDIVLDVYLQVWRKADSFKAERGRPTTWLLVMCRNRALDTLRKFPPGRMTNLDNCPEETIETASQPENMLTTIRRETAIYDALQKLDSLQRQIISLAFYKGLSHSEIAHFINMPLGTVKSHIRKTLKDLKVMLENFNEKT